MVKAKNPGVGQGRGGGRPPGKSTKPARQVVEVALRLSPHVAELLRAMAEDQGAPAWRVVELALLAARAPGSIPVTGIVHGGSTIPSQPLPPEAQEIAQECAAFLEAAQDRPRAARALRRAWTQALALACHDLREVSAPKGEKSHPEGLSMDSQGNPHAGPAAPGALPGITGDHHGDPLLAPEPSEPQAPVSPVRTITRKH